MTGFYILKPDGRIRFGTKWAYADQVDPVLYAKGNFCPVCGRVTPTGPSPDPGSWDEKSPHNSVNWP